MYKRRLFHLLMLFSLLTILFVNDILLSAALSIEGREQNQTAYQELNLVILVKASKRSNDPINVFENNPKTNLEVIQSSIESAFGIHQFPSNAYAGVMAYGHKLILDYDKSCSDQNVEEIIPLQSSLQNVDLTYFKSITGLGNAPTAIALREASRKFPENNNELNVILLIADNVDDCPQQNPEDMAQLLSQEKNIVIYAIGLDPNNETDAELRAIANDHYYKTDNTRAATQAKVKELTELILSILDDLESQVPVPVIVPTPTVSPPELTRSPEFTETTEVFATEASVSTDIPLPTSTPIIVAVPSQTRALSGILVVSILGLILLIMFGFVYWRLHLGTSSKIEEITDVKSDADGKYKTDEYIATKSNRDDIPSVDLDIFLQDVHEAYLAIGQSGKYILLESLKRKLFNKYQDQFDQLLMLTRQKYPSKIWIDKNADSQTIVKIII